MIRNQWYAILESSEVPRGRPVGVTRMGEKLVAWRDSQGKVAIMHDQCPHRGVTLSVGEVHRDCIWCPFHGFEYDASGRCTVIPANGVNTPVPRALRVQTYPAHEAHGLIFVYWGQPDGEVPPPRWFADLDESFSYGSVRDPWHAHYSRVIENQLDVPHVPFIHHSTIGRGNRTVINGPWVEWQDADRFFVYTWMRAEDGTPARRADEVERPDKPFHLEFIFPNLWQNWISPRVRVVVAFAPVDDENTVMVLRFYQNFMRTPGVRNIINRSAMIFNTRVAHEDRRVVVTQRPLRSDLRMGEKLIPGDSPIIAYRRRRQELIEAAMA
jgi:phenylpropionate dioxygenase-like ring-hydroxylating dioxygenase large terminal subunit